MIASLGLILVASTAAPTAPAPLSDLASVVTVTRTQDPEKALHFEVTLPAAQHDVWQALATTAGVEAWLWRDARVDLRPGGDWLVLYPEGKSGGGTVISFAPERRLELHAMAPEWFPTVRKEGTTAVFELTALSPTSTRLTLVQTGWKSGKEWDDAYDYLAKGNAQLLTALYQRFVSGPRH